MRTQNLFWPSGHRIAFWLFPALLIWGSSTASAHPPDMPPFHGVVTSQTTYRIILVRLRAYTNSPRRALVVVHAIGSFRGFGLESSSPPRGPLLFLFLFERGPITRRPQYRIVVAAAAPPRQMGRWFLRFGEEVVPPRLGDGFRFWFLPPSPSLGFGYFSAPPPPGFVMSGINVRVRPVHDVDVVGREEARMGGRDEGRAQQRGGPHADQWISAGRVGGSLAACV